ncbi:LysM peptidoglycan-binding domain-containing protein [Trueperella pyogenes]|uniref:LysM peptidoglycan-binding domain-containing protein n=1 Tax=Trueperella pyogenes TaxID=1661 RepID=UPI00345C9BE1
MTALQIAAVVPSRPARLRAVGTQTPRRAVSGVRPDRPISGARILRAVPAVPSAQSADSVETPRRLQGSLVQSRRTQSIRWQDAGRARGRQVQQRDILMSVGAAIAMLFAFAVGVFLYTALGFGMQAGAVTTVLAGDSLWSIAASMGNDIPTAQVVNDIIALNSLETTALEAGSQLLLPAY